MTTTYQFLSAWITSRIDDERGASLVEYALLVALIAVVCIAAVTALGVRVLPAPFPAAAVARLCEEAGRAARGAGPAPQRAVADELLAAHGRAVAQHLVDDGVVGALFLQRRRASDDL